ncbi:MAG: cob(I)yrinic acid a,c-diamide adenosyltransferase [Clostridia bacterium]|nr:cob(I)yrinic acid a,c-diamide adenosyltransferase [Clostridia bacterium]
MEGNKFYTRGGDTGYTKTIKNFRISKADSIIELLGTLDEFTSSLGLAKTYVDDGKLIEDIEAVQKRMIEISAEVAGGKSTVTQGCVSVIENMIDQYQDVIGEFRGFIVPGKCRASAALDVARTVMRRAERVAVKAGQFGRLPPVLLAYFNRLCDLIYCFARYQDYIYSNNKTEAVRMDMQEINKPQLTLTLAKEISDAIEKKAMGMGLNVVVAIADQGANLMLLHSMDDAYIASAQIAQDKAYTAVSLKMSTQTALELSRGGSLDGLGATSSNKLILLGGGVPLKLENAVLGGLGVSGGTAEQDIELAEYGARYFEGRLK